MSERETNQGGATQAETALQSKPGSVVLGLVAAVRPSEWIKNFLVFAALIFADKLLDPPSVRDAMVAFVSLCLAASATYLFNDIKDREADRAHPRKRHRPIASGLIPPALAATVAVAAAAASMAIAFSLNRPTGLVVLGYLLLTTLYSFFLKHVVILDVLALASGFVLRVIAGAVAINVEFSSWLVLCTFTLALFLGFGKRRHEIVLLEGKAGAHRPILGEYSPHFLDMMMAVVTAAAVMSYVLYTMDPRTIEHFGSRNLIYTSVFVFYGIFRSLYLIHQKSSGGNPADLFYKDFSLLGAVLLWVASVCLLLYF